MRYDSENRAIESSFSGDLNPMSRPRLRCVFIVNEIVKVADSSYSLSAENSNNLNLLCNHVSTDTGVRFFVPGMFVSCTNIYYHVLCFCPYRPTRHTKVVSSH